VHSLLAGWRVSLHRTRADWPIVAAAWLITLLAAVLLSIGPIYSSAASSAGLHRALEDAPASDTNIYASVYLPPSTAEKLDGRVRAELGRVISSLGGSIERDVRTTQTFALPGTQEGGLQDRAVLGFLDGLPDHATLVDGAWPTESAGPSAPIEAVVLQAVAKQLRLGVGDMVPLTVSGFDRNTVVPVRLVGIFEPARAADPFWHGDRQLTSGVAENLSFRTFGPFLTTPMGLLQRSDIPSVHVQWGVFPNFEHLTLDDSSGLRNRIADLPDRLQIAVGGDVVVTTGLPAILGGVERSLLVSRASVLLLMLQLAILAAYAIILTASLLVDYRRVDTALLRSRGAGPWQMAVLSLAEGLLLAIPAVLVAPWLAVGALALLNVVGPLADAHLAIVPQVTLDGYVAASAAGAVCVVLLALPALLAARGFASEQRELSRQETRTFGQRMGIDVALLAVSGIALWQLRLYGAPLTRTVLGSLRLDPLLVAAPAIGLLAGGVLALRILPLLAQGAESLVERGRDLVGSLGIRQLARRPLRYTRSALLLMIAMSTGVFALSYAATWSAAQRDQAAYQVGADVRVVPGRSTGDLPASVLPRAYAGLTGANEVTPVERETDAIAYGSTSGDLLALDADVAAGIVLLRPDESQKPLGELMRLLRAGRPEPPLATLPMGTTSLRVVTLFEGLVLTATVFDPKTQEGHEEPLGPAALRDVRITVSAIVRDARGLLYRVESDQTRAAPLTAIVLSLEPIEERRTEQGAKVDARLDGPIQLAGLGVNVWLPLDTSASGSVGVAKLSAGASRDGPFSEVPLASTGRWTGTTSQSGQVFSSVPADQAGGLAAPLSNEQGSVFGNGPSGPPAQISFLPAPVASLEGAMPVIANEAFLAATRSAPGDTVVVSVEGVLQHPTIAAVVDTFPATDPARPLLIFDEPSLALLRLQATGATRSADEWWIAAGSGASDGLTTSLRSSTFDSIEVVSVVDRTRSLSTDPVALGIIGALTLGFVATGLFAIVGLAVSAAVSARQRRTEFALLRALGLSSRQLSGWLWLENGSLVLISLMAGTSLGLLVGWLVLPFVTVTQQARAPVPPVLVSVPWDRILLLEVVSAAALGCAVLVIAGVLRRLGVGSILRMGED
jgi:hypothetical protein